MVATDNGTKPRAGQPATKRTKEKTGAKRKNGAGAEPHVGRLLQNIYQQTVDEDIPSEMLDLLNKLD